MPLAHEDPRARDALPEPGFWTRLRSSLAIQDVVVTVFVAILLLTAANAPASAAQEASTRRFAAMMAVLVATLLLVRGGLIKNGFVGPLLYRFAVYGSVQLSYFFLGGLLPIVNHTTVDAELHALDLKIFGIEPAVAMDRFVSPLSTEWFSFFYFGYFFILALHVIPILLFVRHRRLLNEFAFGAVLLFCIGHVVYMLVPGYGPYRALASEFRPFPGGAWHDLVMSTVQSGGAQMDIFPSLHTGAPTFITLFSFRHRDRVPFRYTWPIVGVCALNIIGATMFLRWHYVIDVVAGLALAATCMAVAAATSRWEIARRNAGALMPVWPEFFTPVEPIALTPPLLEPARR